MVSQFPYLPLIKPILIEEMFMILKAEVQDRDYALKIRQPLTTFIEYFEKQWMTKVTPAAFTIYNHRLRTTSALESFNSNLNSKLTKMDAFTHFWTQSSMKNFPCLFF